MGELKESLANTLRHQKALTQLEELVEQQKSTGKAVSQAG